MIGLDNPEKYIGEWRFRCMRNMLCCSCERYLQGNEYNICNKIFMCLAFGRRGDWIWLIIQMLLDMMEENKC